MTPSTPGANSLDMQKISEKVYNHDVQNGRQKGKRQRNNQQQSGNEGKWGGCGAQKANGCGKNGMRANAKCVQMNKNIRPPHEMNKMMMISLSSIDEPARPEIEDVEAITGFQDGIPDACGATCPPSMRRARHVGDDRRARDFPMTRVSISSPIN